MKQFTPWRKVVKIDSDMPMTWRLILECGHVAYKPGGTIEQKLPKKVRCPQC